MTQMGGFTPRPAEPAPWGCLGILGLLLVLVVGVLAWDMSRGHSVGDQVVFDGQSGTVLRHWGRNNYEIRLKNANGEYRTVQVTGNELKPVE